MPFFKIFKYILCYCVFTPYSFILSHFNNYIHRYNINDLALLKISKRYNDELMYKARLCHFNYPQTINNSMERKAIYKEAGTINKQIKKLYNQYKNILETNPNIRPESRIYLKKTIDDFYDILMIELPV